MQFSQWGWLRPEALYLRGGTFHRCFQCESLEKILGPYLSSLPPASLMYAPISNPSSHAPLKTVTSVRKLSIHLRGKIDQFSLGSSVIFLPIPFSNLPPRQTPLEPTTLKELRLRPTSLYPAWSEKRTKRIHPKLTFTPT